jgi:tetratricopeptide (TPR) repeat protein
VTSSRVDTSRDLPESVRGMIARKIERLSDSDRKLLLAASVQGEEFESAVLAEALDMDPIELEELIDELERVHRFVQRGEEHEYPDGALTLRCRFVHVLYQNVLYASLTPARRAQQSGRTAQALASHHRKDDTAVAARLAVLFETARDFASAGQYFLKAAQRAASLSGFRESLALARRGLESVNKLPEEPARWQLELGLQMNVALSLRMVKGWVDPELEPTLARARKLCDLLGDPPALFPVLWNLGLFHLIRGDLKGLWAQFDTWTERAEAIGDPIFISSATHILGVSHEFGGDVTQAVRLLERSVQLHDPARHYEYLSMFGMDPGMQARAMLSRSLFAVGFPDRALAQARETVELATWQRTPLTRAFSTLVLQGVHLYRREAAQSIAIGNEVAALAEEHEFPQERAWTKGFMGAALSLAGEIDRGADLLHECLAGIAALRSGLVRSMFLSLYAESLWRAGRLDEGHAIVDEGLEYAESSGERGFLHELHRARGGLFRVAGRLDDAEASYREAVRLAGSASAKSFELRAALDLYSLLAATGRAHEGRTLLAPIYEWFTEGLDTADLVSARELLAGK